MKMCFLISLAVLIAFSCNAQLRLGIQGGILHSINHIKSGLIGGEGYENYSSFNFGIGLLKKLSKENNSETGMLYMQKGYGFHSGATPYYKSAGYKHINYISVNQNFTHNFLHFKKIVLSGGAGVFISKAVSGDFAQNDSSMYAQNHYKDKIKFGNKSSDQFQPWDAGLNILLRLAIKNLNITTTFGPSLTNHIPKASQQSVKEKLQSISFNLGYIFN